MNKAVIAVLITMCAVLGAFAVHEHRKYLDRTVSLAYLDESVRACHHALDEMNRLFIAQFGGMEKADFLAVLPPLADAADISIKVEQDQELVWLGSVPIWLENGRVKRISAD